MASHKASNVSKRHISEYLKILSLAGSMSKYNASSIFSLVLSLLGPRRTGSYSNFT